MKWYVYLVSLIFVKRVVLFIYWGVSVFIHELLCIMLCTMYGVDYLELFI